MNPITNDTVLDFVRRLTNLGGIDYLKEPEMVILDQEGNPRCVTDGDKMKPIQIITSGIVKDENMFLFNPFKNVEGANPAFAWYYTSRGCNLAHLTKMLIAAVIKQAVAKETENYEILHLITEVSSACDEQMHAELMKINAADILRVFYNKKMKTAEAQTVLLTDEIETQYKLRKKSWQTIRKIFRTIFNINEDDTTMSAFKYRAKILGIPEIDAKCHLYGMLLTAMEPWQDLLEIKLEAQEYNAHLENLETYARMYAWFTARTVQEKTVISNQSKSDGLPLRPLEPKTDENTIKLSPASAAPLSPMSPMSPMAPMAPMSGFAAPTYGQPNPYMAPMQPMYYQQPTLAQPIKVDDGAPDRIPITY